MKMQYTDQIKKNLPLLMLCHLRLVTVAVYTIPRSVWAQQLLLIVPESVQFLQDLMSLTREFAHKSHPQSQSSSYMGNNSGHYGFSYAITLTTSELRAAHLTAEVLQKLIVFAGIINKIVKHGYKIFFGKASNPILE